MHNNKTVTNFIWSQGHDNSGSTTRYTLTGTNLEKLYYLVPWREPRTRWLVPYSLKLFLTAFLVNVTDAFVLHLFYKIPSEFFNAKRNKIALFLISNFWLCCVLFFSLCRLRILTLLNLSFCWWIPVKSSSRVLCSF